MYFNVLYAKLVICSSIFTYESAVIINHLTIYKDCLLPVLCLYGKALLCMLQPQTPCRLYISLTGKHPAAKTKPSSKMHDWIMQHVLAPSRVHQCSNTACSGALATPTGMPDKSTPLNVNALPPLIQPTLNPSISLPSPMFNY